MVQRGRGASLPTEGFEGLRVFRKVIGKEFQGNERPSSQERGWKVQHITEWKEQVMGSRDKRGREKKKPKKTESKPASRPARPMVEYKPAAPPSATPPSENKM